MSILATTPKRSSSHGGYYWFISISRPHTTLLPVTRRMKNEIYHIRFERVSSGVTLCATGLWVASFVRDGFESCVVVCPELEASTSKDPSCRGEMHVKSVESSNALLLEWCASSKRTAQVSSSSLDNRSKLRGSSPKALV
ncbi:hypothetical protein TNCV_919801 [Trichonephila clavipes]|nr:hypothetical protein TNCV_919801 [Trichonephila clavipes]